MKKAVSLAVVFVHILVLAFGTFFLSNPQTASCQAGDVCLPGDCKWEASANGGGYEYCVSGFSIEPQADGSVCWGSTDPNFVVDRACVKEGTELHNYGPGIGNSCAGPFDHDISHVVLYGQATAVGPVSFEAAVSGQTIVVSWETATEIDNVGFFLYRDGQRLGGLIPSESPGGGQGASYDYTDVDVQAGITYSYVLEDVDFNGNRTQHGPISAMIPATPPPPPPTEKPGNPWVPATTVTATVTATVSSTVTAVLPDTGNPPAVLPDTGGSVVGWVALGVILIVCGALALYLSRRGK